jgi:antitoxin (DNA-binding transcriptional repressor) of toxin-antitoxin stability system
VDNEPPHIQEAKTHLSRLIDAAAGGETVFLGKHGKPLAKLSAYAPGTEERRLGGLEGEIQMAPDLAVEIAIKVALGNLEAPGGPRRLLKYPGRPRRRSFGTYEKWLRAGIRAATLPPTPEATAGQAGRTC